MLKLGATRFKVGFDHLPYPLVHQHFFEIAPTHIAFSIPLSFKSQNRIGPHGNTPIDHAR